MNSQKNDTIRINNYIGYLNQDYTPKELDVKYDYLLVNGYYNYQEYINHLAEKVQAGDSEALEACLYYFGWRGEGPPEQILGDYYYQLVSGGIDILRPDAFPFIRIFSKEKERNVLNNNHIGMDKAILCRSKMNSISNRLLQYKSREEILNDLIDLLIDRIVKYKPGDRTLRKYIYDMYYLYVADYIQSVFRNKDFMKYQYRRDIIDINDIEDTSIDFKVTHTSDDVFYEWEKKRNTLGPFWINGHTHPIFNSLTKTERMLLRDNVFYKDSLTRVAERYSIARNVVKSQKKKAIDKIKKEIDEQDIWLDERLGYEQYNMIDEIREVD